MLVLIQKR